MNLIPTDSSKLLKKWVKKFHSAQNSYQTLQSLLATFEKEGYSGYQAWLSQRFPQELSMLRENDSEWARLSAAVDAVYFESHWMKCSQFHAYSFVLERMENQAPLNSDEAIRRCHEAQEAERLCHERMFSENSSESGKSDLRNSFREFIESEIGEEAWWMEDAEIDAMMKEVWGKGGFHEQAADSASAEDGDDSAPAEAENSFESFKPSSEVAEIKSLYRNLARRLHPDVSGLEHDASTKQIWSDVQSAYQSRDIDRLRVLWTMVQSGSETVPLEGRSISELMKMVEEAKELKKSLDRQRRKISSMAAFRWFRGRDSQAKQQKLANEVQYDLRESLSIGRIRLMGLRSEWARLGQSPKRRPSRRAKEAHSGDSDRLPK